jgi:hypothetical protein
MWTKMLGSFLEIAALTSILKCCGDAANAAGWHSALLPSAVFAWCVLFLSHPLCASSVLNKFCAL